MSIEAAYLREKLFKEQEKNKKIAKLNEKLILQNIKLKCEKKSLIYRLENLDKNKE